MDAFEQIVEGLYQEQGYWTRIGFKVTLSQQEKVAIGKPSMPRPEIDILAYKPVENELLWIECKSYLDSRGVSYSAFRSDKPRYAERYKTFTQLDYQRIAKEALIRQLVERNLILPNPILRFVLVAGKVVSREKDLIKLHFKERGWEFHDVEWIRERLSEFAKRDYENNVAVMMAKLMGRE